jgi:transposase
MSRKDIKDRLNFARKVKKTLPADFWTSGISFYLDGTSFVHKTNPNDQAKSQKSMVWRKRSEGLNPNCTSKGKKAGSGGRMANFIVAIAYGKGVVLCEQYEDRFTGQYFADFIRKHFPATFKKSANPTRKLFLQDGDPRQNSALAKQAMEDVDARMFAIPPRSPDINPIENFFHLVQLTLNKAALDGGITKETFKEFSVRVRDTINNFPVQTVDKIIDSMDRRMSQIIKLKGERLKY